MPIAREEARRIAAEYLASRPQWRGRRISKVVSHEEIASREPRPYRYFTGRDDDIKDCWIAYLEHGALLECSTILLVAKTDGAVVFVGSAGDEG